MSKSDKKQKPKVILQSSTKFKVLHNLEPWSYVHHKGHSVIEAYVMAKGDWETVAEVKATPHLDAEATAIFITKAVNEYEDNQKLINELVAALELCVDGEGLTWEAEQEAEIVLRRAKEARDFPKRPRNR